MKMPSQRQIRQLQRKIRLFYKKNKRNLPWRKTSNPYNILISEIMLQQTQVERVVFYYHKWLKKWPTIQKLAIASKADVLRQWMGLGYNTRAIHLHKASQKIIESYHGDIIRAMEHYKEIPGIGPYTSGAVQIFSLNKDMVVIDTNIRRILIHEFTLKETIDNIDLLKIAQRCLPKGKSREWHNALMDYGATFLTSRKTGIRPLTKQSTFEGSDRQIRTRILKQILSSKKPLKFLTIKKFLQDIEEKRLKKIINGMVKDNLIFNRKKEYLV